MNTTKITQRKHTLFYTIGLAALFLNLAGCSLKREDVGPYQGDQQTYAFTDFDRIDMGSAFTITVQQGTTFNIAVEGDRRNLADLQVYMRNGTLMAQYRIARRREYQTSFTITMPTVRSVDFSGASRSTITGFSNLSNLDITLSGASESQFTGQSTQTNVKLSGASVLRMNGQGSALSADLSGASILQAFGYSVDNGALESSGASNANVSVAATLVVDASGASNIRYRGKPAVSMRVSGASTVQNDL